MMTRIKHLTHRATSLLVLCMACLLPGLAHAGFSTGTVSGICFVDANNNSVYDPDESGIQGVALSLKKISISSFGAVYTTNTTSDGTGFFEFKGLSPALYMLEIQASENHVCNVPARKFILVSSFTNNILLMFGFANPAAPPPPTLKPAIEIEANPSTLLAGNSTTITWQSINASTVVITPGIGRVPTSGSITVAPTKTTIYTFTVVGRRSVLFKQIKVKVVSKPGQCDDDCDCPTGYECVDGQCRKIDVPEPECEADNDCPSGYECVDGQCRKIDVPEPECETDNDCPSGYECVNGQCQESTLVFLDSFTAISRSDKIILNWSTAAEIDNAGFNLYRSESANGPYEQINASLIPARGWTTMGATYEFIDTDVQNRKTYWYKLEDVDYNGTTTLHGPQKATPRLLYGVIQ